MPTTHPPKPDADWTLFARVTRDRLLAHLRTRSEAEHAEAETEEEKDKIKAHAFDLVRRVAELSDAELVDELDAIEASIVPTIPGFATPPEPDLGPSRVPTTLAELITMKKELGRIVREQDAFRVLLALHRERVVELADAISKGDCIPYHERLWLERCAFDSPFQEIVDIMGQRLHAATEMAT